MNLKEFDFPKTKGIDQAFPTFKTIPELLQEAKDRKFYNGRTVYNSLFSQLFFNGGKVTFKKDVDETFKAKAWPYLRSFMGSWEPSHEEKDAICAMLMSELLEPEIDGKLIK